MHYLKFGNSKRFIVFLHGWGSDLNSFLWLKNYFVDDYSLIFLEMITPQILAVTSCGVKRGRRLL
jgi:predicted esterase